MSRERRRQGQRVTLAQKWRSYGQGAEGDDALCEAAPKPLVWLSSEGEHVDYTLRGPAAQSYCNDGKGD